MGKRLRSLSIQYGEADIRITHHAIRRFRQRIGMRNNDTNAIIKLIRAMVPAAAAVVRRNGVNDRVYLAYDQCVFVMTTCGVIITVLKRHSNDWQFTNSIKDVRREKRQMDRSPYKRRGRSQRVRHRRDRAIMEESDTDEYYGN